MEPIAIPFQNFINLPQEHLEIVEIVEIHYITYMDVLHCKLPVELALAVFPSCTISFMIAPPMVQYIRQ